MHRTADIVHRSMSLTQSNQAKNVTDAQICDVTNGLTDVSILSTLNSS